MCKCGMMNQTQQHSTDHIAHDMDKYVPNNPYYDLMDVVFVADSSSRCRCQTDSSIYRTISARRTHRRISRVVVRLAWAVLFVSSLVNIQFHSPHSRHRSSSSSLVLLAMAAPVDVPDDVGSTANRHASSTSRGLGGRPKWVNPCGIDAGAALELGNDYEMPVIDDAELFKQVAMQAKNALLHANQFKEDYVRQTFKVEFAEHQETWKSHHYDWLPSREDIPKALGEQVSLQHLDSLDVTDALRRTYESLQKYAVGLEQVVLDQAVYDGNFVDNFNEAEHKLKAVLCELQVAMLEKGITARPDVGRQAMTQEIRDIEDDPLRDLRDWFIFRDYMNGLEYTTQLFEHLQTKAASQAADQQKDS